ncbi:restriction endonuclease subunit S [Aeromonas hydrophila]|uniref:restriction endonuclease subunit S n=1 Tax=Aeromonas hydrophila TaxID=644 RepID=UPI003D31B88F
MEQVLYSLPDGWEWHKLKDLTTKIGSGATPKGGEKAYKSSGISLIRSLNVHDCFFKEEKLAFIDDEQANGLKNVVVESGDVLLNITGASIARCCIVPNEFLPARVNQHVAIIRPTEYVDSKFLNYLIVNPKFKAQLLWQGAGGATRQALTKAMVEELNIPLPSLPEQKRIVEKLDALLTRIDTAVEHLQESVTLADALSQNGLDIYFAELTKTNPELPLSKLADFISGYAFKSGDFTSESGVKPIKITNVGVNEFSENAEEFLPVSYESEYQRFAAKANDIVIALTRPIINGGLKVCRVPESYSGALVNQRVAAITSKNKHVLDFIYLYLQSSRTKNYVLEKSKSLNQPNLSITDLKNLALPLPANDEAIAKAVADCNALISKARKSKAEISEKITMMQQLKASILDSAFKGEL